jgi:hypothetical protein
MKIHFVVTLKFDRSYKKLKKKYASIKSDVEYFKEEFSENPQLGIDLGGGYRKVRMAIQSKNKGKSGGARIITYKMSVANNAVTIVLVDIYDKSEQEALPEWEYHTILNEFLDNLGD